MSVMRSLALCALVVAGGHPLLAQEPDDVATAGTSSLANETRRALADPSLGSIIAGVNTSIFLSATQKDKTVTGNLAGTSGDLNYFLRATGPVEEDPTQPTVFADLNGLRKAATGALGISYLKWNPESDFTKAPAWCHTYYSKHLPSQIEAQLDALRKAGRSDSAANLRNQVVDSLSKNKCTYLDLPEEVRSDFERALQVNFGTPILLGATLELGGKDFRYADTVAVSVAKQKGTVYALNVGAGLYLPDARLLFLLGFRQERSFKEGKTAEYCTPVADSPALRCQAVPFGTPAKQAPTLVRGEVRHFLSEFIGLSPRVTIDLDNTDRVGLELPLLVRQGDDKGFTAAITLGWRFGEDEPGHDDKDELLISATVGQVFGVNALPW